MGDFLIDFRPVEKRSAFNKAAEFLKFLPHVALDKFEFPEFSLALTSVDNPLLWAPYFASDIVAVVCGRIDLEEAQWQSAEKVQGAGGLASKYVAMQYRAKGVRSLSEFSGNFSLILWDRLAGKVFLVTDACGALPMFAPDVEATVAWSSHADSLAICLDEQKNWDEASLTEFLFIASVTPPFTFYKKVRSVPCGSLITIDPAKGQVPKVSSYFALDYRGDARTTEQQLADELAGNFVSSVRKRTLPRLGPVAVALSGGLDSRTILAAAPDRSNVLGFCCFDAENFEFAVAREVAHALNVKLTPLSRSFEYYGDNAEMGVRIAGGMGTFANNHFLGVADPLRELGVQNLLTGCYCDYLFKALPLNTLSSSILGKQSLAPYSDQFYFYHYRMQLPAANVVHERLKERFPDKLRRSQAPEDVFELEKRRTFPLFQEGDNEQRLVPQRVLHSYLPVADRAILETYCKIPYQFKLNRSLFKKVAHRICGPKVSQIPDANTGAPVNASLLRESAGLTKMRIARKLQKLRPGIALESSWPDWAYYIPNSKKLEALWKRPCAPADEFFRKVLPASDIRQRPADYKGDDGFFFVQMLSLKIWMSQRC